MQQCLAGSKESQGTQRDRYCVVSQMRNLRPLAIPQAKQGEAREMEDMAQLRTVWKVQCLLQSGMTMVDMCIYISN